MTISTNYSDMYMGYISEPIFNIESFNQAGIGCRLDLT